MGNPSLQIVRVGRKIVANGSALIGVIIRQSRVLTESTVRRLEALQDKKARRVQKKDQRTEGTFYHLDLTAEAIRKLRWTAKRTMQVAQPFVRKWLDYLHAYRLGKTKP